MSNYNDYTVLGVRPSPAIEFVAASVAGDPVRTTRHVGYVDLAPPPANRQGRPSEVSFWLPDSRSYLAAEAQDPTAVVSASVFLAGLTTSVESMLATVHGAQARFLPTPARPDAYQLVVGVQLVTWRVHSATILLGYQVECLVPVGGTDPGTAAPTAA